jgi:4,5-DOPA dioxygenase extradiol
MSRLPVLFLSHGAPPFLDDEGWKGKLRGWAASLPRPRAILVLSAHWEARPILLGATTTVPLIYDFQGFPKRYYDLRYEAPGAPGLAERVRELAALAGLPAASAPDRGLDHGAWVPLLAMWPEADVPVLQVSLPTLDPRALRELGAALAPLRDEGVLIVGSGGMTHNLREIAPGTPPADWAVAFDRWTAEALVAGDVDALVDFERTAPHARRNHPTTEHLVPLLIAAGAAPGERATFPVEGFAFGSLSVRSVQLG